MLYSSIQIATIIVVAHIATMYMVIEGNYELTTAERIKYYSGLSCITYAVEFCSLARRGNQYNIEQLYQDNYIILPLFILPVALTSLYIVGFSIANLITTTRLLTCFAAATILYSYHKNYSFIIPMLITYLPFWTIIHHILVVCCTIILVKYHQHIFMPRNHPQQRQQ